MPTSEQIAGVHRNVRTYLAALAGEKRAAIRILYGGSITSDNAYEILGLIYVADVLIDVASLKAADFDVVLESVPAPEERHCQHPV